MTVRSSTWSGMGLGHGRLRGRRVVVDVVRGSAPRRSVGLWLPGIDQQVAVVDVPVGVEPGQGLDQSMAG